MVIKLKLLSSALALGVSSLGLVPGGLLSPQVPKSGAERLHDEVDMAVEVQMRMIAGPHCQTGCDVGVMLAQLGR